MDQQQQGMKPGNPLQGLADTQAVLDTVACWIPAPLMALSTRAGSMGVSYQGFTMLMGAIAMFLIVALSGGADGPAHASIAVAFLAVVLLWHRIKRPFLWAKGFQCSSHYDGTPNGKGDELNAKQWKIPALGIFTGTMALLFSPGIGIWFIVASVCQSATTAAYRHRLRRQVQGMRDARIQQQVLRDAYEEEQR